MKWTLLTACALAACAQLQAQQTPQTFVTYEQFGAVGDGKTDDIAAIVAAHDYANKNHLPVRADDAKTYFIKNVTKSAVIKTDTDFGKAKFIIDDTDCFAKRGTPIFAVRSSRRTYNLTGVTTLKRNQPNIGVKLKDPALVFIKNDKVKRYIRRGLNQNKGSHQNDIILVDRDGNVDMKAPLIWDFDNISEIKAMPIDENLLTIKGGHFTTIANQAPSKYTYYSRGFSIMRSNVLVTGITHLVTGEGETGAPYGAFIGISRSANVTVENAILSGHKIYKTIGSAGKPVSMGSYDISANSAINITFKNCTQANSFRDGKLWGIFGSNYCKNITYDSCVLSRFDAHMGVANATIRNCKLGTQGINAIGTGTFLIENTTVYNSNFVNLRTDYGSTWEGEFIIRNCVYANPRGSLFAGYNDGDHDFGYTCYMPERIIVDGLKVLDKPRDSATYKGPALFNNFNKQFTTPDFKEKFPFVKTKEVILKNVTTQSGKPFNLGPNPIMFKDVVVTQQ